MFQIDKHQNRITPIPEKRFGELGFSERHHLQEWLAHQPNALNDDLLIIQKEFDGFDDTKERLDLLALDKDGNLVIIENKLDDSGRDVVWQALKYASYCANLSKHQIIDLYQSYLGKHHSNAENNAEELICEFMDVIDVEELKLNIGNSQRIILVAANFRKEVTSTALWLLGQGIAIECFKVTPYALNEQLLLSIEQIIPTPEAKELMIGISAKEAEDRSANIVSKRRHILRTAFWEQALEAFKHSSCSLYNNISPTRDHWLSAGSGVRSCPFNLIFGHSFIRVEFSMQRSSKDENKRIFDYLFGQKEQIEKSFGHSLTWLRLDDKKASRVQYSFGIDGYDKENWPNIIRWLIEHMSALENALDKHLKVINTKLLKSEIKEEYLK